MRAFTVRIAELRLTRAGVFVATVTASYLLPLAIPNVGIDYPYFFMMAIVLMAWLAIKWNAVRSIKEVGSVPEMAGALVVVGADYAFNSYRASAVGMADLVILLLAAAVFAFGLRPLKSFWVPAAYGVILLAGYQIENYTPNYIALQYWLAGVLASAVKLMGIGATAYGQLVIMDAPNGTHLLLEIDSSCTGLQGILAFGMLSTMTLLDMKPKLSRLVPLFIVGFAGAFLINVVRLFVVFLTFEYAGVDAGTTMHVYFGYAIFVAWVVAFWALAFRYLSPVSQNPRPLPSA